MESKALVPVQQALVPFHGYEVLSVRLPDDHVATSHSGLCHMLDVARHGQIERIRRDKKSSEQLVLVRVETTGGPQNIEVLIVDAIPEWALGIQINKLAPEKRPLLLALKAEAFDTFYGYFFKTDTGQADQPAPEEPATTLDSPFEVLYAALDDAKSALDSAKRALHGIEREQEQRETQTLDRFTRMEKYGARVEARLAQLEQRAGHTIDPEADQAAPDNKRILSPLHLVQVSVLARSLRARTGERIDVMMADLAETFGVEDVSDIPDAGWEHVLAWFWQRSQR